MGRRTRLRSDEELAYPHKAGATIILIQVLAHRTFGAIGYAWNEPWKMEHDLSANSRETLKSLQVRILSIDPGKSNMRNIYNNDLLQEIYSAGSDMVVRAVRAVQYLAEAMERMSGEKLMETTVERRLKEATAKLNLNHYAQNPSYQGLAELLPIRDALEHPKPENVYQSDENNWDKVPLAWFISDRGIEAHSRFSEWFGLVADDWLQYLEARNDPHQELAITRGMKSMLSAKKAR
jgi:hypothetical protein